MELNPFEWGLPWYYYSSGGLILVFTIVFFVIYMISRSKITRSERVDNYIQIGKGKENSDNHIISQDSDEYRKWKEGK